MFLNEVSYSHQGWVYLIKKFWVDLSKCIWLEFFQI